MDVDVVSKASGAGEEYADLGGVVMTVIVLSGATDEVQLRLEGSSFRRRSVTAEAIADQFIEVHHAR
jgi:hypothetical protein